MNKEHLSINKKTIRFMRFCKNYGLYQALIKKYRTCQILEVTLSYYSLSNYVCCLQNMVCMDEISRKNLSLQILSDSWNDFASDLIEEHEKQEETMKTLLEYLKSQKTIYRQFTNSFYGYNGSDSTMVHLDDFYRLIHDYASTRY